MLNFVTASRHSREDFAHKSALQRSLARLANHTPAAAGVEPIALRVYPHNRLPLPVVYNEAVALADDQDIMIFVHDDVWIDDWHVGHRLHEALLRFDVVGVAGNRRRTPRQESWWWVGDTRQRDTVFLSGSIIQGPPGGGLLNIYGHAPARVRSLDGVFLATRAGTLRRAGVRFDPRFAFHFYDLDFCRQCDAAGLRLGTWPISLTHESVGEGVRSDAWAEAYRHYLAKWTD